MVSLKTLFVHKGECQAQMLTEEIVGSQWFLYTFPTKSLSMSVHGVKFQKLNVSTTAIGPVRPSSSTAGPHPRLFMGRDLEGKWPESHQNGDHCYMYM
jgi:hypothetical protein